jgi:hypothetical protein
MRTNSSCPKFDEKSDYIALRTILEMMKPDAMPSAHERFKYMRQFTDVMAGVEEAKAHCFTATFFRVLRRMHLMASSCKKCMMTWWC